LKIDVIRGTDAAVDAAIGVGGALVYLFAFPKGAISTLMHQVLHLPGPGAGIALVVGPFLIVVVILSSLRSRGLGGALTAALAFAVGYTLVMRLAGISTYPKGAFGSARFVISVAAFGLTAETVLILGRGMSAAWRCGIAGALANASLLAIYWVFIFPRTTGWVQAGDIPILLGLCLAAGLASGCLGCALSQSLWRAFALDKSGADHVRSR
jgi:hypothetical protein